MEAELDAVYNGGFTRRHQRQIEPPANADDYKVWNRVLGPHFRIRFCEIHYKHWQYMNGTDTPRVLPDVWVKTRDDARIFDGDYLPGYGVRFVTYRSLTLLQLGQTVSGGMILSVVNPINEATFTNHVEMAVKQVLANVATLLRIVPDLVGRVESHKAAKPGESPLRDLLRLIAGRHDRYSRVGGGYPSVLCDCHVRRIVNLT
jgi:hypothetical protein